MWCKRKKRSAAYEGKALCNIGTTVDYQHTLAAARSTLVGLGNLTGGGVRAKLVLVRVDGER
jgi:hypothetical protein